MKKSLWVLFVFSLGLAGCNPNSNILEASGGVNQSGVSIQVRRYIEQLAGGEGVPSIPICELSKTDHECQLYYHGKDDALHKLIYASEARLGILIGNDQLHSYETEQKKNALRKRQQEAVRGLARWHANKRRFVQNEPGLVDATLDGTEYSVVHSPSEPEPSDPDLSS